MKLAAPKRKLVKISPEQFFERIVALPAADSVIKNRVVTLCSTSLPRSTPTPGHIIVTRPTPVKPTVNEAKKELLDSNQIKELNLLSKGKKLLDCCKTGDVAEVKKLIKENAPFIADWVGTSPLHYAVMNKHVEIAELLLKEGISRDSKNKVNRTPLHIAAHMGLAYMVKLLLTYGADVNCRDMLGMTPLHWAAEGADLLTTRILLDYGADVTIVSKFGRTACTTAKINKNNEIVKTILDTEVLPASVRAQKVSEMRSKIIITVRQNLIPVAEILEPSSKAMTTPHTQDKRKKRAVPSDHEADYIAGIENLKQTWKQADGEEKMSADSAIRLLQSHGVSIMEPDKETVLSSAVLNGHMIRLTEAGKLAFKSLEHNVRLDKTSSGTNGQSDSDDGTTPVKRPKISSCSVIVGSSLPECIVDLPPKDPSPVNDNGTPKNLYMQRLKSKQKDITRHVEILRNQLAIKERELNEVNLQINTIESGLNK